MFWMRSFVVKEHSQINVFQVQAVKLRNRWIRDTLRRGRDEKHTNQNTFENDLQVKFQYHNIRYIYRYVPRLLREVCVFSRELL